MSEAKLLHLLKKKRGFFEAMLDLSETEKELTLTELLSVLEQKKILLSCIEEIDKEIQSFKEAFHVLSHDVSQELDQIRTIIEHLLNLDAANQEKRKQELFSNQVFPERVR